MGLFAPELLLDVVVYGLGKVVLSADDRISLLQNVKLEQAQAALSGLLQRHLKVLIDRPLSQGGCPFGSALAISLRKIALQFSMCGMR